MLHGVHRYNRHAVLPAQVFGLLTDAPVGVLRDVDRFGFPFQDRPLRLLSSDCLFSLLQF